jgi:glutathione S-transferase
MKSTENQAGFVMYGAEFSLYSGKLRSYLRKKGIDFTEVQPWLMTYKRFIVPRTGVRYIPVLQTPEDDVWQDTTVIIDHLEERFPHPSVYPGTPRRKLAALILELFGDEWLLLPAMHYRWNYPEENVPFIYGEFGKLLFPRLPVFLQQKMGKKLGDRFRNVVPRLGITEETIPALEFWYEGLLAELDEHFRHHDFLLGSYPTLADFGFIGPFYAHLYRDPAPGKLMRDSAPRVAAWVERMISPDAVAGAASADQAELEDEIPATLMPVLSRFAKEQLPVLADTARVLEEYSAGIGSDEVPRVLGTHQVKIAGVPEERIVVPYSLWMFQRPLDFWRSLQGEDRLQADQMLQNIGAGDLFDLKQQIRIKRENNRLYLDPG